MPAAWRDSVSNVLRENRPEQASWANEELRQQVLEAIWRDFGDHLEWSIQAALAIFFLNPRSSKQVEVILARHLESRRGAFPARHYRNRGWNPAKAASFDGDSGQFWRCYRAYAPGQWTSFEMIRRPVSPADLWRQSGYGFRGWRGCVRKLELDHCVDTADVPDYCGTFVAAASALIRRACSVAASAALTEAILSRSAFEEQVGPVQVSFRMVFLQPDHHGEGQFSFSLRLTHI